MQLVMRISEHRKVSHAYVAKAPTFCQQIRGLVMRIRHCGRFSKPVMLELPCQTFCVMQKQHDSSRPRHFYNLYCCRTSKWRGSKGDDIRKRLYGRGQEEIASGDLCY
ncbi:unnamed protein product [Amoebophrya sp. A120]|nr:unnamed protein product [Amoebophrya sp. A120]|eukprot:GSA120T00022710001.1